MDDLISGVLMWLLIGSLIWAFTDPNHSIDEATRAYVKKKGHLPPRLTVIMGVALVIVLWPVMARALWRRA